MNLNKLLSKKRLTLVYFCDIINYKMKIKVENIL